MFVLFQVRKWSIFPIASGDERWKTEPKTFLICFVTVLLPCFHPSSQSLPTNRFLHSQTISSKWWNCFTKLPTQYVVHWMCSHFTIYYYYYFMKSCSQCWIQAFFSPGGSFCFKEALYIIHNNTRFLVGHLYCNWFWGHINQNCVLKALSSTYFLPPNAYYLFKE